MGQLERYGLYVLCLVIFLILGVAIWGGESQPASAGGGELSADLKRLSNPGVEAPTPEVTVVDNPVLSEFLDLNNEVPRSQGYPPPAAPTEVEQSSAATVSPPAAPVTTRPVETPVVSEAAYYVVRKDDMLTEISLRELGTRHRWKEILALNPGLEEKNLPVGKKIKMPPRKSTSTPETRRWFTYVVKKNDSFSTISSRLYGTQKYWKEIQELNPTVDPLKLRPGSEIRVPLKN